MSSQPAYGQQQLVAAAAPLGTFDQLVDALEDIESLTGGDDAFFEDEVLANRKFLVEPDDIWDIRNTLGYRLPPYHYDGEVFAFKMQMDAFRNFLSGKLVYAVLKEVYMTIDNNEPFSKYLADNEFMPINPWWPATAGHQVRFGDFGLALTNLDACFAGEVC